MADDGGPPKRRRLDEESAKPDELPDELGEWESRSNDCITFRCDVAAGRCEARADGLSGTP